MVLGLADHKTVVADDFEDPEEFVKETTEYLDCTALSGKVDKHA